MAAETYPSRALGALRRGEISLRAYLKDRVHHALMPLASRLTPRQLRQVAAVLEARLKVDPVLTRYVQKLAGPEDGTAPPASRPGGVR